MLLSRNFYHIEIIDESFIKNFYVKLKRLEKAESFEESLVYLKKSLEMDTKSDLIKTKIQDVTNKVMILVL